MKFIWNQMPAANPYNKTNNVHATNILNIGYTNLTDQKSSTRTHIMYSKLKWYMK